MLSERALLATLTSRFFYGGSRTGWRTLTATEPGRAASRAHESHDKPAPQPDGCGTGSGCSAAGLGERPAKELHTADEHGDAADARQSLPRWLAAHAVLHHGPLAVTVSGTVRQVLRRTT